MIVKAYLASKRGKLYALTFSCAVLHTVNFIAAIIFYGAINNMYTFSVPLCYPKVEKQNTGSYQFMTLNITIATAIFSMLSAVFHWLSLFNWGQFNAMVLKRYNVIRWLEYSISASLMAVIIDAINGVNDVVTLLYHFGSVSLLMWAGLLVEYAGLGSTVSMYVSVAANLAYSTVLAANILTVLSFTSQADDATVLYVISFTIGTLFACFGYYQAFWQLYEYCKTPSHDGSVYLKVYDLSFGLAKGLSPATLGARIEMVPHTSVLYRGCEIFVMNGLQCTTEAQAERMVGMSPSDIIKLGTSSRSEQEVVSWLNSDTAISYGNNYRLLNNNCMDFCNSICKFMGVGMVPNDLYEIPAKVMHSNATLYQLWSDYNMKHSVHSPPPKSGRLPSEYTSSGMPFSRYLTYEMGYLLLSLVSKTLLTYLILWAGIVGHDWTRFYKCIPPGPCSNVFFNGTTQSTLCHTQAPHAYNFIENAGLVGTAGSESTCATLISMSGHSSGTYFAGSGYCYYCYPCTYTPSEDPYAIGIDLGPCASTVPSESASATDTTSATPTTSVTPTRSRPSQTSQIGPD